MLMIQWATLYFLRREEVSSMSQDLCLNSRAWSKSLGRTFKNLSNRLISIFKEGGSWWRIAPRFFSKGLMQLK